MHGAEEIDLDCPAMKGDIRILVSPEYAGAGVVDPDVDAAEGVFGLPRQSLHRLRVGDIGRNGQGSTAQRLTFLCEAGQDIGTARPENHDRALTSKGQRRGAADAAGGAGDDDARADHLAPLTA